MEPGEGVAVQDHEVGSHLPGHCDPVPHQLLVHVEQHVVCIPEHNTEHGVTHNEQKGFKKSTFNLLNILNIKKSRVYVTFLPSTNGVKTEKHRFTFQVSWLFITLSR